MYRNGFELKGADATGMCYNTTLTPALFDYGDPVVSFAQNLVYGCGVSLNQTELQDYCSNSDARVGALEIFSNLNFW